MDPQGRRESLGKLLGLFCVRPSLARPGEVIPKETIGKPWENAGLIWFNGVLYDLSSGQRFRKTMD